MTGLSSASRYDGIVSEAGLLPVNGIELYVETHRGPDVDPRTPPLLTLHGIGGHADAMGPEVLGLSGDRPVIAFDARGHGRSTRPARYTLADHVADAVGVVEALGVDRFAVLGVSMGSYVAPGVVVAASGRVAGLVLVVAKGHGAESSSARLMRERPELFAGRTAEEVAQAMFEIVISPQTTAAERQALAERLAPLARPELTLGPEEFQRANDALAGFDNRPLFPRIGCPTLVVSARDDALNPPVDGEAVAAAIPGARFEVVERAGHILTAERTAEYLALVRPFLRQLDELPQD